MSMRLSEEQHRRIDELIQQQQQEHLEQELMFDEAMESVRKQDEATYVDSVEGHDDIVTNSDYSEHEKVAAEMEQERVETKAKRLRMEAQQRNPSDEATTAPQLLAQAPPVQAKIVLEKDTEKRL